MDVEFEEAVLVVAHPDDELLWFSSILKKVAHVIVCFTDCDDFPDLGAARHRVMQEYPLKNVSWLGVPEPCSSEAVNWDHPVETESGLALNAEPMDGARQQRYDASFRRLTTTLAPLLAQAKHVFTHNPWGEYGHADHVQVSRAVRQGQANLGFRLWYSNYVAPRSMPLAGRHLERLKHYFTLLTDQPTTRQLLALYQENGAWTWHRDYRFPACEAFLGETPTLARHTQASVPLNCVSVQEKPPQS